jgi:hypothetical protein
MTSTLDPTLGTPAGPARTRSGWTSGRVVAMLIGALLALCSLGLLAGGGYLLSAATGDDGWLALGHGAYRTDGYAVATDAEDWSTASYVLGTVDKVRIRVTRPTPPPRCSWAWPDRPTWSATSAASST